MNFANWGFGGSSSASMKTNVMEEVMRNGNVPVAGKMGPGMGGGGVVPPALLDENRVPKFYLEAITACGATNSNMLPHTALVYNMMVTSGLPRPVLSYIWSAVNRSLPGQLTRSEFFSCMALIALAQKGESLAALSNMSQLPIPFLQACAVPTQGTPIVSVVKPVQQSNPINLTKEPTKLAAKSVPAISKPPTNNSSKLAFVPTNLLGNRKSQPPSTSNSSDLLSEIFTSPAGSQISSSVTTSSAEDDSTSSLTTSSVFSTSKSIPESLSNDLESIDWSGNISSSASTTTFGQSSISNGSMSTPYVNAVLQSNNQPKKIIDSNQLDCWARAVCGACELLEQADSLWHAEKEVIREVADTEKGEAYLQSLEKVVFVLGRIMSSSSDHLPPDLCKRACAARKIWEKLDGLVTSLGNTFESDTGRECGICSHGVALSCRVDYGGHMYHSECANLWVNNVNPLLPNLHLR